MTKSYIYIFLFTQLIGSESITFIFDNENIPISDDFKVEYTITVNNTVKKELEEIKPVSSRRSKMYNNKYLKFKIPFTYNKYIGEESCSKNNKIKISFKVSKDNKSKSGIQYLMPSFWGDDCVNIDEDIALKPNNIHKDMYFSDSKII